MAQREEILTAANGSVTGNRVVRFAIGDSLRFPCAKPIAIFSVWAVSIQAVGSFSEILLLQRSGKQNTQSNFTPHNHSSAALRALS